jgi:uncharacterized protein (DUF1015 family)
MAKVYPFRALRYALAKIPIEKVVTQPYDKISREMQDRYYELHPNNIIRIVLGKATAADNASDNVYTRAAATLKEWRNSGALEKLEAPAFFAYFQRFTVPGSGEIRERKGFIGIAQLEDYANGVVFPHERTLTGPKKDRLELLRHTRTHFEQIFMLYEDPQQQIDRILDQVAAGKADIELEDEYGVTHTIWTITERATLAAVQQQMADKKLIIADGHHRYETALTYRDEMRAASGKVDPDAPYERMTMTFFNMEAPGLEILPTHRVLANVAGYEYDEFMTRAADFFAISTPPSAADELRSALRRAGTQQLTIGVCSGKERQMALLTLKKELNLATILPDLSPRLRQLDVVILHRLLIEKCLGISEDAVRKESHITYLRELDQALKAVAEGRAQLAFLLNPTSLHQMRDVAYQGIVMPQKSTDFYPKVLSGLTMYALEQE